MERPAITERFPEFRAGIYRHYKGPLYQTIGLTHDSNYEDRTCVLYIGLYLDQAKQGPRFAIRTYEDFYTWVDPQTGEAVDKDTEGAKQRFEYLGDSWEGQL